MPANRASLPIGQNDFARSVERVLRQAAAETDPATRAWVLRVLGDKPEQKQSKKPKPKRKS
jgi:hypothetical protein